MKKNKKLIITSIFILIFLFIIAFSLVYKTFQNDTFYTIKIGKLILNNWIDMKDHFSIHVLSYTYPHWLYDLLIYLIYLLGGYTGIYISSIILFFVLITVIYIGDYKLSKSLIGALVGALVCMITIRKNITARAQTVSYILFALELFNIEFFLNTGKKKYAVFLLIISLLICNMHVAVWPFYFILFLPYIAEYLISLILKRIKSENKFLSYLKQKIIVDDDIKIKRLLIVMGLSLFTGLLTPIKDTPYTYLIKTMMGNSQKYILEHATITLKDSQLVIVVFLQMVFWTFFSKIKLRDIFLILGTTFMGIMSTRHISLLAIIASICLARTIAMFFNENTKNADEKIIDFLKKYFYIPIICFIGAIIFSTITFKKEVKKPYIDNTFYPVEMVKYIKENIDIENMRLFNDYNMGSYILMNDIPVFIDSRADLYTKEFSGLDYDIFVDYMEICGDYNEKLDFYKITHLLLYKDNDLDRFISIDPKYKLIKEDEYFRFYEKIAK